MKLNPLHRRHLQPPGFISLALAALTWAACFFAPPDAVGAPAQIWEHVYPQPTGHNLASITHGPPGFVVVATSGEILFSGDGEQWIRSTNTVHYGVSFTCVRYAHDRFMAVGNAGAVFLSFDGRTWTRAEVPSTAVLRTCAGAAGIYVIGADDATLLISTNCVDWEVRTVPQRFVGIAQGETNAVAITDISILASENLVNWSVVRSNAPYGGVGYATKSVWTMFVGGGPIYDSVSYGGGRFVVTGAWAHDIYDSQFGSVILYSDNAVNWESAALPTHDVHGEIMDSTYANGTFVAVRPGVILRSADGANWTTCTIPTESRARAVAASPEGRFVAVGDTGEILVSDDAQIWRRITESPREPIQRIEFADGRFVAVGGSPWYVGQGPGSSAVLTSKDGRKWKSSLTNLPNQLSSAAYGRGTWVVTGDDGQIFASPDAMHWEDVGIRNTTHDLSHVVFGNRRFLAFASWRDTVYCSLDGKSWKRREVEGASTAPWGRFLNGRFVSAWTNGTVMFSPDGLHWRLRRTPATQDLVSVTYAKGRYVAGGNSVIVSSRNGIKWEATPVPLSVRAVESVNGWFVAIGPHSETLVSRDAINWQPGNVPENDDIWRVVAGNGIVVGAAGFNLYRATISVQDGQPVE